MNSDNTSPPLMKPAEVARLLNVTTKCLRDWRMAKPARGPAFLKTGDGDSCRIRYSREAVAAWIKQRTNNPTEDKS